MSEKPRERHRIMIDIPENTHRNLKVMTALKGMTVQQYIRGLIQADIIINIKIKIKIKIKVKIKIILIVIIIVVTVTVVTVTAALSLVTARISDHSRRGSLTLQMSLTLLVASLLNIHILSLI